MAILDFLFGRTKRTPTTTTVQQSSKLPEEIAPFVKEVLGEAQDLFQQRKAEGFREFPGETIAPRTAEELAAMEGLRGLVGTQEPYRAEAEEVIRATPTQFTAEDAQRLMSPYQRAVTDIEKREAQRVFERDVQPALEAKAIQAGGMSGLGTRAALQAAEAQRQQSQLLADIEAKGQQRAFEQAYRQFGDEVALQRQRAGDIQQQGQQRFNIGLAERGLQQQLGQEDRAEAQALLNEQFAEFLEREQFPESTLAQYSSFIYGNPFLRTPDTTRTTTGMLEPTTSMGQGLLNLGLTGLNIYGRGGGFGQGGFSANQFFTGRRTAAGGSVGKGLVSLPVVNRRGAGAVDPRLTSLRQRSPQSIRAPFEELLRRGVTNIEQPDRAEARRLGQKLPTGLQALRDTTEKNRRAALKARAEEQAGFRERLRESQMAQFEDSDMLSQPIAEAVKAISAPGMETKGFINQLAAGLSALTAGQDKMSRAEKKEIAKVEKELISQEAAAASLMADRKAELANQLSKADEAILRATTQAEIDDANFEKNRLAENLKISDTASQIYARLLDEETDYIKALNEKAKKGELDDGDYKTLRATAKDILGYYVTEDGRTVRISDNQVLSDDDPALVKLEAVVTQLAEDLESSGKNWAKLAKKGENIARTLKNAKTLPTATTTDSAGNKVPAIDINKLVDGELYKTPDGTGVQRWNKSTGEFEKAI
tara:strand:+ start:1084 stop:3210 length:2127 start_codon:yes stop_codon:yes gene_type:complete